MLRLPLYGSPQYGGIHRFDSGCGGRPLSGIRGKSRLGRGNTGTYRCSVRPEVRFGFRFGFRRRRLRITERLAAERFILCYAARNLAADRLDDAFATVHHDVARPVYLVDEVAIDEDSREDPASQEQNQRPEDPDMAVQPSGRLDTEGPAPTRGTAQAPVLAEGEPGGSANRG